MTPRSLPAFLQHQTGASKSLRQWTRIDTLHRQAALLWAGALLTMSFLKWGSQNQKHHFKCVLTSTVYVYHLLQSKL